MLNSKSEDHLAAHAAAFKSILRMRQHSLFIQHPAPTKKNGYAQRDRTQRTRYTQIERVFFPRSFLIYKKKICAVDEREPTRITEGIRLGKRVRIENINEKFKLKYIKM